MHGQRSSKMAKFFEIGHEMSNLATLEQYNIEPLLKSRASPAVINVRLPEMLHLLDGLKVHGKKVELTLQGAGDKSWVEVLSKRYEHSRQVTTFQKHVHEYLNVNEASKTVPLNMNRTRVFPYAGETQLVTCAQNNG